MRKYTILDLDNTISDDSWRIPKIDWQHADPQRRYHNYHLLAGFDELGNDELSRGKSHIIIFTARPVMYHAITAEWLRRKGIDPAILMMRNNEDHRKSVELKKQQLIWLGHHGIHFDEIEHAYDDRADVVDMYRSNGIPASIAAIHNVCAYTEPSTRSTAA